MTEVEREIRLGSYSVGLNGVAMVDNTFWLDFSVAEMGGLVGVQDTYDRAKEEWKEDIAMMTALCITLNHKIWQHYRANRPDSQKMSKLYDKLWKDCDSYILETGGGADYKNFNKEQVKYFLEATD